MNKAIVENGKVINIIVHESGELTLPEGQQLIDPQGQVVGLGFGYDAETGLFTDNREPETTPVEAEGGEEADSPGLIGKMAAGLRSLLRL